MSNEAGPVEHAEQKVWHPPDASREVNWQHDAGNNAYTLAKGDIRCRVWRMLGAWQAIVSCCGEAVNGYNFPSVEAACAWCEAQVRER